MLIELSKESFSGKAQQPITVYHGNEIVMGYIFSESSRFVQ
jgi:hypothetical protein